MILYLLFFIFITIQAYFRHRGQKLKDCWKDVLVDYIIGAVVVAVIELLDWKFDLAPKNEIVSFIVVILGVGLVGTAWYLDMIKKKTKISHILLLIYLGIMLISMIFWR